MEEGVHGLEGVEQQGVMAQDLGQDLLVLAQTGGEAWGVGGIAQGGFALRGQQTLQREDVVHTQGAFGEKDLLPAQLELAAQKFNGLLVPGAALNLQTHRSQTVALFHDFAHVLAVVLVHVIGLVLGADVGVAGDGTHCLALDAEGGEELFGVLQQYVLGEDVPHPTLPQDKIGGQALGDGNETQGLLAIALQP